VDDLALPKRRRRGIYLLPNLFTTGTLFGGFYAIVSGMQRDFYSAAVAVFIAMICDSLDGFVARKTNTASDFGKEYDSLCDMVAFGVAASLVMYSYALHYLSEYKYLGGKLGWVVAFMYTACAALRLARFNVLASRGEAKGNFFGMPSPAAAAVIVGFVWMADDFHWRGGDPSILFTAAFLTVGASLLMVSNIRFFSLKSIKLGDKLTERVPFRYIVIVIALLTLFSIEPPLIFFLFFFTYAVSGPALAVHRRLKPGSSGAPRGEPPSL